MAARKLHTTLVLGLLLTSTAIPISALRTPKVHTVALGPSKRVPYSAAFDPAGAQPGDKELRVRPLLVDDKIKDWTTGEMHAVTERSFTVRRAIRLNDALPGEKGDRWIWQRGPWLLVDRSNGHYTALKLPDYDPAVSQVVWYRDYAAYCGLSASGKQLYAIVAQLGARKPALSKKLATWLPQEPAPGIARVPACTPALWQREPLRITFQQTGEATVSYGLIGLSAVLVEEGDAGEESGDDSAVRSNPAASNFP